jgi:hypothetical protein
LGRIMHKHARPTPLARSSPPPVHRMRWRCR